MNIEESDEVWKKMYDCKNCLYHDNRHPHMGFKPCKKHYKLYYKDKIKLGEKIIADIEREIEEMKKKVERGWNEFGLF
jgi:hypothetical protein